MPSHRTGLTRLADQDPIAQRVTLRDTAEAWLAVILFGIAADDPLLQQLRAALPAPEDPDRTPQVAVCRPGATASAMTLLRAEWLSLRHRGLRHRPHRRHRRISA